MVQGGQTLVKYLLFFFNFLFVVTGIALIALGAVVKTKASNFVKYLGAETTSTAVFIIVVGVIIFFIAFLGCCGAIKENYCMVMTFSVLLFIIFVMELGAGIAAYVLRDKLRVQINKSLQEDIKSYNDQDNDWDNLQISLDCCGSTNYSDWYANSVFNDSHTLPSSCCRDQPKNGTCAAGLPNLREEGCLNALEDLIMHNIAAIGGSGIGIAFVEVVGIIFACCLARAIKKEYETV